MNHLNSVSNQIQVFEIKSLQDKNFLDAMDQAAAQDSVFLSDLDETVMEPGTMLGTAGSKEHLKAVFASMRLKKANLYDILTLVVSKKMPIKPVEPCAPEIYRQVQGRVKVLGLTARGKEQWRKSKIQGIAELTKYQLASIGVDFSRVQNPFADARDEKYQPYGGIFFTAEKPKGEFLKELFANSAYRPARIYFIDDKRDQVDSMVKAAGELGVPITAFHYQCVDKSAENAQQDVAIVQLVRLVMDQIVVNDERAKAEAASITDIDRTLRETLAYLDDLPAVDSALRVSDIEINLGMVI